MKEIVLLILSISLLFVSCSPSPDVSPTLTELPPPSETPLPTNTPTPLPEKAEVIRAFFEAFSNNQKKEMLSYLADNVGVKIHNECYYGDSAHEELAAVMFESTQWTVQGLNYEVNGDQVSFIFKNYADGQAILAYPTKYIVREGKIQYENGCKP